MASQVRPRPTERSTHEPRGPSGSSPKLALGLLVAAAISRPMTLWAANTHLGVSVSKLALHSIGSLALGLGFYWIFRRFRLAEAPAALCGVMIMLVVVNWDTLQQRTLGFGLLALGIGIGLVWRLSGTGLLTGLLWVGIAVLGVAPVIQLLAAVTASGPSHADSPESFESVTASGMVEDIVLVIMDQYAGLPFLEAYGHDTGPFVDDLISAGMTVPDAAWSTATTTYVSIPEMLNMQPFLPDGVVAVGADYEVSYDIMGGNNLLASSLKSAGYDYTHIESGWEGTRCGPAVDTCVIAPWLDSTAWELWYPTMFGGALESAIGHPYSHGALAAVEALESKLQELQANDARDYLFVHVLLPHGPFLLQDNCERSETRDQTAFDWHSHAAFVAQVRCAESIVRRIASGIDDSTALLITGDHGNPTLEQGVLPENWSDLALAERLSTFMAFHLPPACDQPEEAVTAVVVASLAGCAVLELPAMSDPTFTGVLNDLPGTPSHRIVRVSESRADRVRMVKPDADSLVVNPDDAVDYGA